MSECRKCAFMDRECDNSCIAYSDKFFGSCARLDFEHEISWTYAKIREKGLEVVLYTSFDGQELFE